MLEHVDERFDSYVNTITRLTTQNVCSVIAAVLALTYALNAMIKDVVANQRRIMLCTLSCGHMHFQMIQRTRITVWVALGAIDARK